MSLEVLDAARAALLVIDMQNAFCHPDGTLGRSGVDVGPAQDVIKPIAELVQAARQAGLPVIWTVQLHLDRDASRARRRLPSHTDKRARVSAVAGTWDAQIVDELAGLADDPTFVIEKHRFGAFHQTRLEQLLKMLGVDALIVTGVTANACVETTLREAYLRDYDVVAVTDCIAAVRPQWYPVAQEVWAQYLCVLASSDEVRRWLEGQQRPRALQLHHLLLEVADLETAERFYVDTLGFRVRSRNTLRDGRPFFNTEQGLGITATSGERRGLVGHLAFRVRDVDGLAERVRAAGYRVLRGPDAGPYGRTVYVEDPDGNEIELIGEEPMR